MRHMLLLLLLVLAGKLSAQTGGSISGHIRLRDSHAGLAGAEVGLDGRWMAHADSAGFARLVAMTRTFGGAGMFTGAVYNPVLEIVSTAGLIDQSTWLLDGFVTVAMNCWLWVAVSVAAVGLIEILAALATGRAVNPVIMPLWTSFIAPTDLIQFSNISRSRKLQ